MLSRLLYLHPHMDSHVIKILMRLSMPYSFDPRPSTPVSLPGQFSKNNTATVKWHEEALQRAKAHADKTAGTSVTTTVPAAHNEIGGDIKTNPSLQIASLLATCAIAPFLRGRPSLVVNDGIAHKSACFSPRKILG